MDKRELETIRWQFRYLVFSKAVGEVFSGFVQKDDVVRTALTEYLSLLQEKMVLQGDSFPGLDSAETGLLLDEYEEQIKGVFVHLRKLLEQS